MTRYLVALAIVVVSGCTSAPPTIPFTPCEERPCDEPPQDIADFARARNMSSTWLISRECARHDTELLAMLFQISARRDVSVAFWGRDSELTRTAIVRALDRSDVPAANLKLAFFGEPADAQLVRSAVLAQGGTYVEAPMLPNNALERTVGQRGSRLAATSTSCSAVQRNR